jgi:hypothetical protein
MWYPDPTPITTPRCAWEERRTSAEASVVRLCFRYGRVTAHDGKSYCAQHWRMVESMEAVA